MNPEKSKAEFLQSVTATAAIAHRVGMDEAATIAAMVDASVVSMRGNSSTRAGKFCATDTLTLGELRHLVAAAYGKPCRYLPDLVLKWSPKPTAGMSLDHIVPLRLGGSNSADNIQIISRRANAMKEDLSANAFYRILALIDDFDEHDRKSIERRLVATRAAVFGRKS